MIYMKKIFISTVLCFCINICIGEQMKENVHVRAFDFIKTLATKSVNQEHPISEEVASKKIKNQLSYIKKEDDLFALAVLMYESYPELGENNVDRILFSARELVVLRLASLKSEKAYFYFLKIKEIYGVESSKYIEYKYFKKYSKDEEIKNAVSEFEFI